MTLAYLRGNIPHLPGLFLVIAILTYTMTFFVILLDSIKLRKKITSTSVPLKYPGGKYSTPVFRIQYPLGIKWLFQLLLQLRRMHQISITPKSFSYQLSIILKISQVDFGNNRLNTRLASTPSLPPPSPSCIQPLSGFKSLLYLYLYLSSFIRPTSISCRSLSLIGSNCCGLLLLSIVVVHCCCPLLLSIVVVHCCCPLLLSIVVVHCCCPLLLSIVVVHCCCPLLLSIVVVYCCCLLLCCLLLLSYCCLLLSIVVVYCYCLLLLSIVVYCCCLLLLSIVVVYCCCLIVAIVVVYCCCLLLLSIVVVYCCCLLLLSIVVVYCCCLLLLSIVVVYC